MVGIGRFELPTSPLSGVRSNRLSYMPVFGFFSGTKRSLKTKQDREGKTLQKTAAIDLESAETKLCVKLLRKEVIQPHLPIRLPCYDFTPITGPTFDGSVPCGFGHRLRVLPTLVV